MCAAVSWLLSAVSGLPVVLSPWVWNTDSFSSVSLGQIALSLAQRHSGSKEMLQRMCTIQEDQQLAGQGELQQPMRVLCSGAKLQVAIPVTPVPPLIGPPAMKEKLENAMLPPHKSNKAESASVALGDIRKLCWNYFVGGVGYGKWAVE